VSEVHLENEQWAIITSFSKQFGASTSADPGPDIDLSDEQPTKASSSMSERSDPSNVAVDSPWQRAKHCDPTVQIRWGIESDLSETQEENAPRPMRVSSELASKTNAEI
jgi:hypothetical protein